MDMDTPMSKLKAQLGIDIPDSRSSKSRSAEPSVVVDLLKDLDLINQKYADHGRKEIRTSQGIKREAIELLDKLGPTVWPDFNGNADSPTWLLHSSDTQYPRLYYSDPADRAVLAELFYYLVCAKVANHHKGWIRKHPKESRPSDSDYHPNSGNPVDSGDHDPSTCENLTEEGDDYIPSASTTLLNEPQDQDSVPQLARHQMMPPNIAPVAHMSSNQRSPCNLGSEQNAVASDYMRMMRPTKQGKRRNNDHLNQVDGSSDAAYTYTPRPSLGGLPFPKSSEVRSASLNPVGHSQPPSTLYTKRPMAESLGKFSNKRSRISPSGALLSRGKTAPPQPSYDPLPSPDLPDLDEIVARIPASLVDQQVDLTGSGNWPRQDNYQRPSVQSEESSDGARDTEGAEDTSHVPTRVEPTQTVPEAAPFPDDTTEATIATQRQSDVVTKEQATAEFWKLWSDDAQPICDQFVSNVLDRMSAREAMQCLLPQLIKILDGLPSINAQIDLLSMSEQAQRSYIEQLSGLQQQEHGMTGDGNGPTDDIPSTTEASQAIVSSSNIGGSDVARAETVNRTTNVNTQPEEAQPAPPAAAQSAGQAPEAPVDDGRSDALHNGSSPGLTAQERTSGPVEQLDHLSTAELNKLVRHINMSVRVTRGDGSNVVKGSTIGIEDMRDDRGFFAALQQEYGDLLNPDEDFFRATVTEASDEEQTDVLALLLKGSQRGRSWGKFLQTLRSIYERDEVDIKMELVANVLVTRRTDA